MTSVVQQGPYELTSEAIQDVVTQKSPGSFMLGHILPDGTFKPRVVGRATQDVRQELELQARLNPQYDGFKFRYAASPHAAFEQQCTDFHTCGECVGLENKKHPARPSHTDWRCPVCDTAFLQD